jgi:hypothetical protein
VKYFLYLFVTVFPFLQISSEDKLRPIFQEDRHIIYYRSIMISSSIGRIENLVNALTCCDERSLILLKKEIDIIKFNLGELYLCNKEECCASY